MKREQERKSPIQSLLARYRAAFQTRENLNQSSSQDYKNAERKFLKYALEQRRIEIEEELFR